MLLRTTVKGRCAKEGVVSYEMHSPERERCPLRERP